LPASRIRSAPLTGAAASTANPGTPRDRASERWQQYRRRAIGAEHPSAVPGISRRLADLAPTLVLSGGDDPQRDEARIYAERLRGAGIAVTYCLLPSAQGWPEASAWAM